MNFCHVRSDPLTEAIFLLAWYKRCILSILCSLKTAISVICWCLLSHWVLELLSLSHLFTFQFSLMIFFYFYYYHFMGFIECSYLWLSFKWDTFGSHFSFFMIFALVFEARLYLFITLMARFWHSIQSRLPHPIILFKLCLKFSRWLLYLSLNPSKTGQKLFVFIQHLRVLNT